MPKKAEKKKKKYQRDVREHVKAGKINNSQGIFVRASEITPQNAMVSMMISGYHLG